VSCTRTRPGLWECEQGGLFQPRRARGAIINRKLGIGTKIPEKRRLRPQEGEDAVPSTRESTESRSYACSASLDPRKKGASMWKGKGKTPVGAGNHGHRCKWLSYRAKVRALITGASRGAAEKVQDRTLPPYT